MTEAEMKEQIQTAQDMMAGLENQRNSHANELVQLAAQLRAAHRKISELEKKVQTFSAPELPMSNGHNAEAAAHA